MAMGFTPHRFIVLIFTMQTLKTVYGLLDATVKEDAVTGTTLSASLPAPGSGYGYVLFNGGDPEAAKLFSVSADGKITVKQKLNFVNGGKNSYELIVVKRKLGSNIDGTPDVVRVTIEDINNHDPLFKKTAYEGYISEGAAVGSPVLGLKDCFATDKDSSGVASYEIVDGNKDNIFVAKVKDISGLKLLVIETTRTIDREALGTTPFLNLQVQAVDGGNPARKSSKTTVLIKILDKNDNDPVFEKTDWRVTIQEDFAVKTSVLKVVATDNDAGSNQQLYYYFPDTQNDFIIDPYTGVIYVAAPLNHGAKSSYKMNVVVTDRAVDNPRTSTCTVHITLVKVPGYPKATAINTAPYFSPPTYILKVRDDLPVGAFVLLPRAFDKDGTGNNNGKLSFSMLDKSSTNPFTINQNSGAITVEKKLTPGKKPIEFTVKVEDGGASQTTASIKIEVKAIAKNNGPPKFVQSTIKVDLFDDASTTATVFTAEAKDTDSVKYAIVGGSGLGRFKINEVTGVVNPKVIFRAIGTYDLYIEAKDQNQFQESSLMYAQINIKAHSANPVFSKAMYEASVTEHEPVGTFVTAVFASFPDKTKAVRYALEGDANEFKLDPTSGVVTTKVGLDYELITERRLTVKASVDGLKQTSDAILYIRVKNKNDEKPSFPNQNIVLSVPENLGYIPSLVCLFARDGDGPDQLKYSIKSGNVDNLFKIDPKTGQLSAQNLDYEKRSSYILQVEATDGANTATASVSITVLDDGVNPEPPHFAPYSEVVSVDEGSATRVIKELSVTAASSGTFTCEFGFDVTPSILDYFSVTTRVSSCGIETRRPLKWTKETPSYKFTVRAINRNNARQWSTAFVVVNIADVNDHAPEFDQESYAVSVFSSAKIGSSILQLRATDKDDKRNGEVKYSLMANADSPSFTVDPFSGILKVANKLHPGKEYKVTARATDNGVDVRYKEVQVTIGVHPDGTMLPIFISPTIASKKISEDVSSGDVMTVKVIAQSGKLQYSIVGGNIGNAFDIDDSGKIVVKKKLDYESVPAYKLVVRATKSGVTPALVKETTVTIEIEDSNDNGPVFNVRGSSVEVTIQANADKGLVTSMYRAFDKDSGKNGNIKYTLRSTSATTPFETDLETGIIVTAVKITTPATYNLILKATDEGSPSKSAELAIKVIVVAAATAPPSFQDRNYKGTMKDNTISGQQIGEVTIQNNPQNKFIQYQIIAGNTDDSFCIDYTRSAYAQKSFDFDTWKKPSFELTIALLYENSMSATELWAAIPKDNDNAPIFVGGSAPVVKVLPEDTVKGTFVHQFTAYDLDKSVGGIVYSIHGYGNEYSNDMFAIDSVSGKVTLEKSLDYEVLSKHVLTIKATETESYKRYAYKTLIVNVIDVNDEAPLFSVSSSRYYLAKDALKGEKVAEVIASDLDSGTNGEITYSITNDNMNLFQIDPKTGVITLKDTISLVAQDSHSITVTATDKGAKPKTGQSVLTVETVITDGPPKFALDVFKFNVKENSAFSGQTKAISVDTLTYSILAGNVDKRFKIDETRGYMSSAAKLDAEQGIKYTLTIQAKDVSDRTSTAQVVINVQNLNDNGPMFKNAKDGMIEKVVSDKVTAGEVMLTVDGYDLDVDDALTYEISEKKNFEIGPKDGVIKLKQDWSKVGSSKNFVEFEVKASDRGTPKKSATANVRIVFANFKPDHVKIVRSVPEDAPVSSPAVITDLPRVFPRGGYQIIYPKKHPFKISTSTGDITLAEKLDFETVQSYDIVVQEDNYNKAEKIRYLNYKLEVKVIDVNDNAPVFAMESSSARVNKNARPGTQVIKLVAKDADSGDAGRLSFEIVTSGVPFTVNPVTHYVEVSKQNAFTKNQYAIEVKAVDGGVPQLSSKSVPLTINVVNVPPEFEKMLYKFKVSENAVVEKVVGTVKARSLSGISVSYAIDSGNTNDKFRIDNSGNLIVQRPLDHEADPSAFSLVISAQELAEKPLKSTANVIVELMDINDNLPVFTNIVYKPSDIPEDTPVNSVILTVKATDKDCGKNGMCVPGRLIYKTNEFKDTFKVNAITGEIRNIKPLDYETKSSYQFDVQVEDSGIKKNTAKARVIITVKNVNDNSPVFNPNKQTVFIDDSLSRGATVTLVQASDADNDPLTYSMTGSSDAFVINSRNGLVTVNTDRLQLTKYTYTITASDGKSQGEFALEINIEDKNDKAPKFKGCDKYKAVVEENKPAGQFVVQATATDEDYSGRSKEIEYTLLQITTSKETVDQPVVGSGSSRTKDFTIDKTGTIRTNRMFDREAESHYTIIVIARDGGPNRTDAERNAAACQITVRVTDVNDNKPVFAIEYFETSVADNMAVSSVILITSAIDVDEGANAKVTYSMDSHPLFEIIDPNKGEISIKSPLQSKVGIYQFLVKASDSGNPRMSTSVNVKIVVDANTPPKFTRTTYTARINENKGAGSPVITVEAKSVSGANVVYSLPKGTLPETNKDMFAIDSRTGMIKVAGELNYEAIKKYIVYVLAKDEKNGMISMAIVYIDVLDVNDNLPLFILRRFEYLTVTEGQSPGVVGRVFASDKDSTTNAEVTYSMGPSSNKVNFEVDSVTGELRSTTVFDREKTQQELFSVVVTDKGNTNFHSDVSVFVKIIDINDNAPVLTPKVYSGSVKEDKKVGFRVLSIKATDLDAGDNAKVQFYITGGNEKGYFTTSKSTFSKGVSTAYIVVAKPLDRETDDTFKLTITATDSKFTDTGEVTIKVLDANDNPPVFLKDYYTGSIDENAKEGTVVATVKAEDKDSAAVQTPIKYSLGADADGMFVINADTGVITTGPKPFDRETKPSYRFTVIASDGVLKGSAVVQCTVKDVNDEKPYFPGAPFTRYVEEHKPIGTVVGYIPAKDDDDPNAGGNAKIKYSIVGPNQGFAIDKDTGLMTTLKDFDRESKDSPIFKVKVKAADSGIPQQENETVVTIVITDANDNDPYFTKKSFSGKVRECDPAGTKITTVTAVDKDDQNTVNAQLMYYVVSSSHNSAKYFHLDGKTGTVTVAHGLDYENSATYKLVVGVKDRGIPQRPAKREETATVDIIVTDCNDNLPVFIPDFYSVKVKENAKVGSTLLTVTAVDKDKGSNGEFTFGIVDDEQNFQFGIQSAASNKSKGIIRLLYPVDREAVAHHVFRVSASDMGVPKLTGYATVNITLIDVNDNGPHFDKKDYCGKVYEERSGVQVVSTIKVADPDAGTFSCPCKFSFESGETGLFEIRPAGLNTIEVVTKSSAVFDREKKQLYTLRIAATDSGSPPMKNVTTLKVDVHDTNDNEPSSGGDLSLLVNSYKGEFKGGVIGKVYIKDNDRGTHDVYSHTLTSQSPGKYFTVNRTSGEISVAPNVPDGKYKLAFRSKELNRKVGPDQGKEVVSSATVTVRAISEKQAKTSVALRMTGLSKALTCNEMAYPDFEAILAKILGVPVSSVTVFSAQPVKDLHRGVDVRFSVKKSPKAGYAGDDNEYVDKSTLVPLLNAKKKEIEAATKGKVASVGIDPCAKETCQVGFCYNDIQPQKTFGVITDDNGIVPANPASQTFISIDVHVVATCLAEPRKPKTCKDKPCLFGGKCKDLVTGGYTCSCPNKKNYDGPECQYTTKSFKTKDSYLWVKPFNYFFEGTLSFEFGTKEPNGIILYQGPVSSITSTETKDFLVIELVDGRLKISVNQGDTFRNFLSTVNTKNKLNDGVFHKVVIYKREKVIKVTVDQCRDAEVVETASGSTQDRSSCEITGVIKGPYKFINGLNPLQLGGIKNKNIAYPPLTVKDSFNGCIRKVTDNGIVYDLSKPIEEKDVGPGCPLAIKCPNCIYGYCKMDQLPFVCVCHFGWTGANCDRRVDSYHYLKESYSEYTFPKRSLLTWKQKYQSVYQVQLQTKTNGIVLYEGSPTTTGSPKEFSILEVANNYLQYRYNLGGGTKTLILRGANASDYKWHNVTVERIGNFATLTMHGVGQVSGTVGSHMLLDSDGVVYGGGVPSVFNMKPPYDLQGCLGDFRVQNIYLDSDNAVERKRVNVDKNGCPCVGIVCLNGGVCVAGSPPYCLCKDGFTGYNCGTPIRPQAGALAVVTKDGYMVMAVLLVVFLLALVLVALLLAGRLGRKKKVPVYIDDEPRDNIMPYYDEGAGEDDFHNYDLEKLLKHAGAARNGLANGAVGAKDIEKEALLTHEEIAGEQAVPAVALRQKKARFEGANVESVDVARFITSRLAEANSEDAAYPRDTLLHYGYEGEGSDVDDLSELGDSEDESDDEDGDFGFLGEWGAKFDNLNKIFNPPAEEFDEDV